MRYLSSFTLALAAATVVGASANAQFRLRQFPHLPLPNVMSDTYDIVAGDIDGDGRKDIITANGTNTQVGNLNQIYLADGRGHYTLATQGRMPAIGLFTFSVELGDVDGDGDLDLFCANGAEDSLLLNDGKGRFTDVSKTHLPQLQRESWDSLFADLDGDKDLDLVVAGDVNGTLALLINDGTGKFSEQTPSNLQIQSKWLDACDFDLDGDIDLVVAGPQNDKATCFRNDGAGVWTQVWQANIGAGQAYVQFLNGDGDKWPDLVIADEVSLRMLGGNGSNFSAWNSRTDIQSLVTTSDQLRVLASGDFDNDGDDDVILTFEGPQAQPNRPPTITFENHSGAFLTVLSRQSSQVPTYSLRQNARVLDLDDDGDLDLLWAQGRPWDPNAAGEANEMHLNTLRQVTTPWSPTIGVPFAFEYHATSQSPGKPVFVLPLLGMALLPGAVPVHDLGMLQLDPRMIWPLQTATIPPSGSLSLLLPVPNDPGLRGIDVLVQAIYLEGNTALDIHLSAAAGDTLR